MRIVVSDIYIKLMHNILKNQRYHTMNYLVYLENMKVNKEEKLTCKLNNKKKKHDVQINDLKRPLNQGLKLEKVIKFNEKEWFRTYIDSNTKLHRKAKTDFT